MVTRHTWAVRNTANFVMSDLRIAQAALFVEMSDSGQSVQPVTDLGDDEAMLLAKKRGYYRESSRKHRRKKKVR